MAISTTTDADRKRSGDDEGIVSDVAIPTTSSSGTATEKATTAPTTTATATAATSETAADEEASTAKLRRQLLLLRSIRCLRNAHLAPPPISVPYYRSPPPEGCGFDPSVVVWLGSWYSALVALCEMPSGLVSDGLGRKPTLKLSFELLGAAWLVGYGSCRWSSSLGGENAPLYGSGLSQVLRALGSSLYSGTDMAFLFELLKKHKRSQRGGKGDQAYATDAIDDLVLEHESKQVVLGTATEAVFAAMGGLLARSCGGATPIWMSALPLITAAGICCLLEDTKVDVATGRAAAAKDDADADGADTASEKDAVADGPKRRPSLRWAAEILHRKPPLRVVFGVGVLLNCATYVAATALNPLLWQQAGLGEASGGFLQATNSGMAALGALSAPALKKRCGRGRGDDDGTRGLLLLLLGAGAAAYGLMARNALVAGSPMTTYVTTVAAAWLLSLVRGLGWPVLGSSLNAAIGENNDGTRATVLSLFAGAVKLGMVLAGTLLGSVLRGGDREEAASLGKACALGASLLSVTSLAVTIVGAPSSRAPSSPPPPETADGEGKKDR